MKITKQQLKRIIAEESKKIQAEVADQPPYEESEEEAEDRRYMEAMQDLYDALEPALSKARRAGISYPDMQTVLDDIIDAINYQ